ncbi:hypothetical protein BJF85_02375 [Saccharomonospora sp. CUA-673]|uniref:DUF4383 domain-containing protein n=1 Tax=Saccharomonospora sp. CUA-673 TaxID=1904969 RepID=UPI00095F3CAD|nr:DUF4383 domain-containing protein [Saccharomonospora sp. CUA-673]OLT45311.1 hypothetical protein BJF85_02375 [Saccharomonospora sp. CUA-673]
MSGRHAHEDTHGLRRGGWERALISTVGVVYLMLGVAGLATGPGEVLIFSSGLLLDIVRTAVGLLCLSALHPRTSATALGWFLAVGFIALAAYGIPAAIATQPIDMDRVFPVGWADNVLHLVTALVGLIVGLARYRVGKTATDGPHARPA